MSIYKPVDSPTYRKPRIANFDLSRRRSFTSCYHPDSLDFVYDPLLNLGIGSRRLSSPLDTFHSKDINSADLLEERLYLILRSHKLFTDISNKEFVRDIVRNFKLRYFKGPDPPIIRYGDTGRALYIIFSGSVEVVSADNETVLAILEEGSFFGEIALLFSVARTASVRAIKKCICFSLSKAHFDEMLQKYPDVAQVFYETSKERFVQFKERIEMIENEREQTIRQIRQILQMVPRIKHCNIGFLHVLAMKLATELAAPLQRELENFTIFQKLIIFIGGNVSILGTDKKIVAEIKGAGYFGALFNSSKNSEKYTAVMESNCLICNLTLEGIKKLFPLYPEIEKQLKEDVPLLSVEREPALKKAVSCIGESPSLRSTSGTHEKPLSSLRTYSLDFHTLKKFSRVNITLEEEMNKIPSKKLDKKLIKRILSSLPTADLLRVIVVSKLWKSIILSSKKVWKRFYWEMAQLRLDDSLLYYYTDIIKKLHKQIDEISLKDCWELSEGSIISCFQQLSPKKVDLFGCWGLTSGVVSSLSHSSPGLTHLRLTGCRKIGDQALVDIANSCLDLLSLEVGHCKNLSEVSLEYILARCRLLEKLSVRRCTSISSSSFLHFRRYPANNLKFLDLSDCSFLKDDAIEAVVVGCPELKTLLLSFCEELTPLVMTFIAENCKNLKKLDMSSCNKAITDEGIRRLTVSNSLRRTLKVLRSCIAFSPISLELIDEHFPELKALDISTCRLIRKFSVHSATQTKTVLYNKR